MQTRGTFPALNSGMRRNKVSKVMHEFVEGVLHSGSKTGKKVTSRKQAIAIGLSEQRRERGAGHGVSFGSKTRQRVIDAPKTLGERRNASHRKAYGR